MKSLTEIIYRYKDTEFSWGELDCCIFTVLVIEEFTHKKLPFWREVINYNNYKGSLESLNKLGCNTIKDLPSIILGTDKKAATKAKLGEPIYYINEDNIGILGVCNGKRAYFLQKGGGLTARKIEDCKYSWRIN